MAVTEALYSFGPCTGCQRFFLGGTQAAIVVALLFLALAIGTRFALGFRAAFIGALHAMARKAARRRRSATMHRKRQLPNAVNVLSPCAPRRMETALLSCQPFDRSVSLSWFVVSMIRRLIPTTRKEGLRRGVSKIRSSYGKSNELEQSAVRRHGDRKRCSEI